MTRNTITRHPPLGAAATAAAATGEGMVRVIYTGFSENGKPSSLCVRSALGA